MKCEVHSNTFCDKCNKKTKNKLIERKDTVHALQLICSVCGKHIKWVSTSPEKRKITSKYDFDHICNFYHLSEDIFCFFCGRHRHQLGENETMTIDHIHELSEGGKDELYNLQILCSSCHKLKNWNRTYILRHIFGGFGKK